ncbi:MAG: hypothetical protein AAB019_00570 [Planctomycetota bacterium]
MDTEKDIIKRLIKSKKITPEQGKRLLKVIAKADSKGKQKRKKKNDK